MLRTGSEDVPIAVSEDAAEGRVAEVYAEYRRVTGLAHTSLLLRELAGNGPAVLDAAWEVLRPHYADGGLAGARDALLSGAGLPSLQFGPADLVGLTHDGAHDTGRLRATLRTFATANATNLVLVHLLARPAASEPLVAAGVTAGTVRPSGPGPTAGPDPAPSAEPLPLPAPDSLAPELQARVMDVARALVDDPPPGWWPTLLLCVAPFPPLLEAFAREVDANVSGLRSFAGELSRHAGELAAALPRSAEGATSRGLEGDAAVAVARLVARYRSVLPAFTALAQASLEAVDRLGTV